MIYFHHMNLANKITISRIMLVPLFVSFILYAKLKLALFIFLIAVVSDAVDGYIARTWHQKTKLGAMLDPIADKVLIISAFVCLIFIKDTPSYAILPPYVPIIVISRDGIIILGTVLIYMLKGDVEIRPAFLGKLTTFFQMLTVIFILAQLRYAGVVWNIMVAFTAASGLQYIIRGSRMLSESSNKNH